MDSGQGGAFGRYVLQELRKISQAVQSLVTASIQALAAAPVNALIGVVRYATGDWATSLGGEGLYVNKSGGWTQIIDKPALTTALAKATAQDSGAFGYSITSTANRIAVGTGVHLTPTSTGRVLVIATGIFNTSGGVEVIHDIRYGTGASPAQGANISSASPLGATNTPTDTTSTIGYMGWALNGVALNLTVGQEYWFDVGFQVNTGTVTVFDVSLSAVEI